MQVVWKVNGGVITLSPHGESTQNSPTTDPGVYIGRGGPETYVVYSPKVLKLVTCPVEGVPSRENNPGSPREPFMH